MTETASKSTQQMPHITRQCQHTIHTINSSTRVVPGSPLKVIEALRTVTPFIGNNDFERKLFPGFAAFMFREVVVQWLETFTAAEKNEVFYSLFLGVQPSRAFIAIASAFQWARNTYLVSTLVKLFETFEEKNSLVGVILSAAEEKKAEQEHVIRNLVTLPDVALNASYGQITGKIHPNQYYPCLARNILDVLLLENLGDDATVKKKSEFCAKVVGKASILGHSRSMFSWWMPELSKLTHNNMFADMILRTSSGLESLLREWLLLCEEDKHKRNFIQIMRSKFNDTPQLKSLLCDKFLLVYCFNSNNWVLETILAYLALISIDADDTEESPILVTVLVSVIEIWGDEDTHKSCTQEQLEYLSKIIVGGFAFLPDSIQFAHGKRLTLGVAKAMQPLMSSSVAHTRQLGCLVGEMCTKIADPDRALVFKIDRKSPAGMALEPFAEKKTWHLEPVEECPGPIVPLTSENATAPKFTSGFQSNLKYEDSPSTHKITTGFQALQVKTADDPDEPISLLASAEPADRNSQDDYDPDDITDQDDDDDDEFPAYPMPNDDDNPSQTKKAPVYIRDALEGLMAKDDATRVETCFRNMEKLIDAEPPGLSDIATRVASTLLHMTNAYALNDFREVRQGALVALTTKCPTVVGKYLTEQFYEQGYTLSHRMDMLDTIVAAVQRLSKIDSPTIHNLAASGMKQLLHGKEKYASESKDKLNDKKEQLNNETDQEFRQRTAREIVDARIERKTRRFIKKRELPPTKENRFSEFVGVFFYPLIHRYDKPIPTLDLLGGNSLLLARLLYTLGAILHATGSATVAQNMAGVLLNLVISIQNHGDPLVRRSMAFCLLIVLQQRQEFGGDYLFTNHPIEMREARIWFQRSVETDPDAECRCLSMAGLAALS
eukprot:m.45524 g.45524  ORF g.45524 m.45524 type:complete len:892 (+) comp10257_c0_seq2:83-2758(+)